MEQESLLAMRVMFGVGVLGAGAVGAVTLLAPRLASRYVFAGATDVNTYLRILGALWLALGLVACLGLDRPMQFAPLLLIQFLYKSAWLVAVAYPALLNGDRDPGLVFLTALFTAWAGALAFVIPFGPLLLGG